MTRIVGLDVLEVGNPWKNWILVRLTTDTGIAGVGEATLNGFSWTVRAAIEELRSGVVGRDPHDFTAIHHDLLVQRYSDGGQIHRAAAAGIELACWDILGKELGQPVHVLWGGRVRDSVPLYANGWYRTQREPALVVREAQRAVNAGYGAIKIDPFGDAAGQLPRTERELSLRLIRSLRESLPSVTVFVEGHCRFNVPTALGLAKDLADLGASWFEEPITFRNPKGLIEIANRSPIPIATGENFTSIRQFLELLQGSSNFIFQPDVLNLGGLAEARRVCELAEEFQIPVAPHDAQGPISKAACLQLAAACRAVFVQEDFEEFNEPWTKSLSTLIEKRDGQAVLPVGPGLGRSVDFELAKSFPGREGNFLALWEKGWEARKSRSETA